MKEIFSTETRTCFTKIEYGCLLVSRVRYGACNLFFSDWNSNDFPVQITDGNLSADFDKYL